MNSIVNQTTFNIGNSITVDANNQNAVDRFSPLLLTDWIQHTKQNYTDVNLLLSYYNLYLNKWYSVKNISSAQKQQYTTNLYLNLFQEIAVNYTSLEEKRFIQNIDFTDPKQVLAVLPFFVRKIREICLYFASLRENLKTTTIKNNLRGSVTGIRKIIYNEIIESLNSTSVQNTLIRQNVDLDNLKQNTAIEVEELFDTSTSYYDLSADNFDVKVFYDFNKATTATISSYPIFISELGTNNFSVTLDPNTTDLSLLKNKDFINQFNNLDPQNLKLNLISELVEQYVGTDFFYLSTNSTGTNYVSGLLFKSNSEAQNILNKRNPSIALTPDINKLKSKREIGGLFIPENLGVANFYAFNISYKTNDLKPNTVYTFPDPSKFGNISGLTQISYDSPLIFFEDVSFAKVSNTNTFAWGKAVSDPLLKTFSGYSSKTEDRLTDNTGLERYVDPQDFFTGLTDNKWANIDVFPIETLGQHPIESRIDGLHIDNVSTLVQYKTDIYGNEYGLFKEIKKQVNPASVNNPNFNTCLALSGGLFNTVTYTNSTLTSSFSGLSNFAYYLVTPTFFPSTFCDSTPKFTLDVFTDLTFIFNSEYTPEVWSLANYFIPYLNPYELMSGGKFLVNGTDPIENLTPSSHGNTLFYNVTSTVSQTQLFNQTNNLLEDLSLYEERESTYGKLFFRGSNTSNILPISASLSGLFVNFNQTILNEIYTKLKHFDIIYNTFVLKTENYLALVPFSYDTNLQSLVAQNSLTTFISTANSFEKISNVWFNEEQNELFIAKTTIYPELSSTISKAIYPKIYIYKNGLINRIYPPTNFTSYSQVSSFSLSDTNYRINIFSVEEPKLSYNSKLDKFSLTYIARDSSLLPYITVVYFKYNTVIYDIEPVLYKPQCFCHSEDYINDSNSDISTQQALCDFSSNNVEIRNNVLTFNPL